MCKKKVIILSIIISLFAAFILFCVVFVRSRSFVIHIEYDFDGIPSDCSSESSLYMGVGDGCESCFGFGNNNNNSKTFKGIDFSGLSLFFVDDIRVIEGSTVQFCYRLSFPKKTEKPMNETVFVHITYDDNGELYYQADCEGSEAIEVINKKEYIICNIAFH